MAPVAERHREHPPPAVLSTRSPTTALFWRLFTINALVFVGAALALVLTPATVSAPVSFRELGVLAAGSAIMLALNATLLRASLRPLSGLTGLMERVDLLRPGQRAAVDGNHDVVHVIHAFNDMLDRLEDEREISSSRALAALENERKRIARELHDEIGQGLTAVLLALKRAIDQAPPELATELRTAQELVRGSLNEVREVAGRLRPGVLEDLGLSAAIEGLATEFSKTTDIPVTSAVPGELTALPEHTELALYRITQESLTNIARHAAARHVTLTLSEHDASLVLTICDDGQGLHGAVDGGGIRGMRERAMLIHADLTITPNPSGGCQVRLLVPVNGAAAR